MMERPPALANRRRLLLCCVRLRVAPLKLACLWRRPPLLSPRGSGLRRFGLLLPPASRPVSAAGNPESVWRWTFSVSDSFPTAPPRIVFNAVGIQLLINPFGEAHLLDAFDISGPRTIRKAVQGMLNRLFRT